MPLARIITNAVDESLDLTMQLRARGFRVETVTPDKTFTTPADLEVRLEECASEEIVARAAAAEPNDNLWVFVAPGALDERARPMRVVSLVPQTGLARSSEAKPVSQQAKVPEAEVVSFPPLEDDPILAELENDVILQEQQEAKLREVASETSKFETIAHFESAPASGPINTDSEPQPLRSAGQAKSDTSLAASKAQAAVPSNTSGLFSIPRIPDPPPAKSVPKGEIRQKARPAVYKISFQTGPSFWRAAWVSMALVVLVGILALIMETKPNLPANAAKPVSAPSYPSSPSLPASDTRHPGPALNLERESNSVLQATPSDSQVGTNAPQVSTATAPKSSHVRADDIIAEDTVVFYDRPHRPGSSKVSGQTRPPKYSDQD